MQEEIGRPLCVIADLQGPKLRIGYILELVVLERGSGVTLVGAEHPVDGSLPVSPAVIGDVLRPGHHVLIDDGLIRGSMVEDVEHGRLGSGMGCRAGGERDAVGAVVGGQPGRATRSRWKAMTMSVVQGHDCWKRTIGLAAGVGDDGGGVPDAVTQLLGFGDGELAVEAQRLGPGVEVLGDQHQLQPGFVADEVLAGQVAQPGVFGGADAVLDMGRGDGGAARGRRCRCRSGR